MFMSMFLDPPQEPLITPKGTSWSENTETTFTCSSAGGYPAPAFKWMKRGQELQGSNYVKSEDGGDSSSQVTITLTHVDDGRDLECSIIHPLVNVTTKQQLTVLCKYCYDMVSILV